MQDIMPPVGADAQLIQSYGASGFRIGHGTYDTPVLVLPTSTMLWSGELTIAALEPILNSTPPTEVLLIGTGKRHEMIPPELRKELKARGVGVDTMDTGAACRTFNILLGEGRMVAAALLLSA
jgi:uncharacterized protein